MNPVKPSPLDWLSFPPTSPGDVHAPHPDLFDLELEASIGTLPQSDQEQLQLLSIDLSDPYSFLRSETPRCGPPSSFTVSSESTYGGDSYSSHSESLYNYSDFDGNNTDYNLDLAIDFANFSVDVDAAAAEAKEQLDAATAAAVAAVSRIKEEHDTHSAALSKFEDDHSLPSDRNNANSNNNNNNIFTVPFTSVDVAFQDSTAAQSVSNDYYPSAIYNLKSLAAAQAGISPSSLLPLVVPPVIPSMEHASVSPTPSSGSGAAASAAAAEEHRDPRKRYKCPSCPRAFARAYNLKTHLQTHDPNRLKPHTCPHRSCGRSFSRKHDLGRHLISIHRDEHTPNDNDNAKAIGVAQGARGWCNDCGAGWIGKQGGCACHDVK